MQESETETVGTLVIGAEHHGALRAALLRVVGEMGARDIGRWQGVGGSQEISVLTVVIDGRKPTAEAETYVGLSLTGDAELVAQVAGRVHTARAVVFSDPVYPGLPGLPGRARQ